MLKLIQLTLFATLSIMIINNEQTSKDNDTELTEKFFRDAFVTDNRNVRSKESDCRITPQLYGVVNVFASSSDHPSVESIHAKLIDHCLTISLVMVYKTIDRLKSEKEILQLEFKG